MQRQPQRSGSVKSAGYDPTSSELAIEFATGKVYRYSDVPASVLGWLVRTKNKGSFVSRMISPHYAYRLVGDERVPQGTAPEDLLDALKASLSR
jgi:hypothetical protein